MKNHRIRFISGLLLCVLALAGCQSDVTLSKVVRKGDTVVVSLGDADPNGQHSNLKSTLVRKNDIIAAILDSNWVAHPVKVRHVFRVYGDPTAVNQNARGQAQWMAVVDLVNPTGPGKPNLAIGNAALILDSEKFDEPQVVKTEIIAGVGTPHEFISQNEPADFGLDKLEFIKPAKQALVRVGGTLPQGVKLAGAAYRFDIPDVHAFDALLNRIEAAAAAKLPSDQQIYFEFKRTERQAPQGTDVLVVLTSTEGLDQANLSAFNFVMISDLDDIANNDTYWQDHVSGATFYDTDGQEIANLMHQIGENE
jgi:hypothetical protein